VARQFSISVQARSAGARPQVYRLLTDSSTWADWTPFTSVTLVGGGAGGGEGVGAVRQTRYGGLAGRERIVALVPDRQISYAYIKGVFTPYMRDYVALVDLEDDGEGTLVHWHSTYTARFPGSGWVPYGTLRRFLQKCADGLAAAAGAGPTGAGPTGTGPTGAGPTGAGP
jgi:uncharacterized protein YndB with AHSA1/START domain